MHSISSEFKGCNIFAWKVSLVVAVFVIVCLSLKESFKIHNKSCWEAMMQGNFLTPWLIRWMSPFYRKCFTSLTSSHKASINHSHKLALCPFLHNTIWLAALAFAMLCCHTDEKWKFSVHKVTNIIWHDRTTIIVIRRIFMLRLLRFETNKCRNKVFSQSVTSPPARRGKLGWNFAGETWRKTKALRHLFTAAWNDLFFSRRWETVK